MNRRDFFKRVAGGAAVVALAPTLPASADPIGYRLWACEGNKGWTELRAPNQQGVMQTVRADPYASDKMYWLTVPQVTYR